MRSRSARENMPGPPPSPVSGSGTCAAAASPGTSSQSLAASGCQQTKEMRPPGRSTSAMLEKAASGSSKNMTPNRLIATSNAAPKRWVWASRARTRRCRCRARWPAVGRDRASVRRRRRRLPQPRCRRRSVWSSRNRSRCRGPGRRGCRQRQRRRRRRTVGAAGRSGPGRRPSGSASSLFQCCRWVSFMGSPVSGVVESADAHAASEIVETAPRGRGGGGEERTTEFVDDKRCCGLCDEQSGPSGHRFDRRRVAVGVPQPQPRGGGSGPRPGPGHPPGTTPRSPTHRRAPPRQRSPRPPGGAAPATAPRTASPASTINPASVARCRLSGSAKPGTASASSATVIEIGCLIERCGARLVERQHRAE